MVADTVAKAIRQTIEQPGTVPPVVSPTICIDYPTVRSIMERFTPSIRIPTTWTGPRWWCRNRSINTVGLVYSPPIPSNCSRLNFQVVLTSGTIKVSIPMSSTICTAVPSLSTRPAAPAWPLRHGKPKNWVWVISCTGITTATLFHKVCLVRLNTPRDPSMPSCPLLCLIPPTGVTTASTMMRPMPSRKRKITWAIPSREVPTTTSTNTTTYSPISVTFPGLPSSLAVYSCNQLQATSPIPTVWTKNRSLSNWVMVTVHVTWQPMSTSTGPPG